MEKVPITFGPPQTFEEAIYRLPQKDSLIRDSDHEMNSLAEVGIYLKEILKYDLHRPESAVDQRIIDISPSVLRLMERWSFKRKPAEEIEAGWDETITVSRSRKFDMIPAEELYRTVKVYKMQPELPEEFSDFIFVCIEVKPDRVGGDRPEYMLAFLDEVEYEILIGADSSSSL